MRSAKEFVVHPHLLGVGDGERRDRAIELRGTARIACQQRGIARSGVNFCEHFSTKDRKFRKRTTVELGGIEGCLMIGQLSDEVLVSAKARVAEKRIGQGLHHLLPLSHTPALVTN